MHSNDLHRVLRDAGQRLTPQRLMILDVMAGAEGHVTAEEIYERVRDTYPYINVSTVYRTLEALKELDLVTETDLGRGLRQFELRLRGRHHHLVCKRCRSIEELEDVVFDPVRQYVRDRHGFQAQVEHHVIFGLCATCDSGDTRVS
jgi:Fur family transcriptional regulator, ferric uptake regulator